MPEQQQRRRWAGFQIQAAMHEKADRLHTGVGTHSPWRNDRAPFQRGALGKP